MINKNSLEHSMEALRAFADTPDVCIYLTDFYTGEILMCNNTYAGYAGKTYEGIIGTYCYENLGYSSRCPRCPYLELIDQNGNPLPPLTWENHLKKFDVHFQVTSRALYWLDGRLANMTVATDITQRKKMENELYELAFFDRALKIPNSERMKQDMMECDHSHIVAINLADLRRISNIFGRDLIDALLQTVCDYMQSMNIEGSTLYRGKLCDFCILFKNVGENKDLPVKIAEKIHKRCKQVWVISVGEQTQNIFTSVSVCVLPTRNDSKNFFGYFYSAMEHSLEISRKTDRVIIYDEDTREKFHKELELELSLKNAVRQGMRGFYAVYQPIVDMRVAMWKGVEALCRWDSPEFGQIPPAVFIPMAESCGLIGAIGLWILEESIKQVKEYKLDKVDQFLLEVNLSPVQLTIPCLDKIIMEILKKYNYPPEKLGLEITKSSEMNFSKYTIKAIKRLSKLGVVIILDDFGTGCSSFNSLHKMPAKILKTDRTFITGMASDSYLQNLVSVMIILAHGSDMKLVAEGVETDLQFQLLLNQGADFFQGYFFSHPLTAKQLFEKLDHFYHPIERLISIRQTKWNLSDHDEGKYEDKYEDKKDLNPSMHQLLNRCIKELFINTNLNDAIGTVLSHAGEEFTLSRAHVLLKEDDGTYTLTHEWHDQNIPSMKTLLNHFPLEQKSHQWLKAIKKELIIVSDTNTLHKNDYEETYLKGIKAFIQFPIWKDGELKGYTEFQNCQEPCLWKNEEIQILNDITDLIASALGRMELLNEITAINKMRENVLNDLHIVIYISDLETNEILFTNMEIRKMYKNSSLPGRACWETLHNKNKRCPFCPIPYLLKNPGKSFQWEFFNEAAGKHFRVHNSIIPWVEGKLAHLSYGVESERVK